MRTKSFHGARTPASHASNHNATAGSPVNLQAGYNLRLVTTPDKRSGIPGFTQLVLGLKITYVFGHKRVSLRAQEGALINGH